MITNITGKKMGRATVTSNFKLKDISEYPSGLYIAYVRNKSGKIILNHIIQHTK